MAQGRTGGSAIIWHGRPTLGRAGGFQFEESEKVIHSFMTLWLRAVADSALHDSVLVRPSLYRNSWERSDPFPRILGKTGI